MEGRRNGWRRAVRGSNDPCVSITAALHTHTHTHTPHTHTLTTMGGREGERERGGGKSETGEKK